LGGGEVVVLLGPAEAEEQIRDCLAIGADRAFLQTDQEWDPQATAAAIVDAVRDEQAFDLILFGNDRQTRHYQVGIRVASRSGCGRHGAEEGSRCRRQGRCELRRRRRARRLRGAAAAVLTRSKG